MHAACLAAVGAAEQHVWSVSGDQQIVVWNAQVRLWPLPALHHRPLYATFISRCLVAFAPQTGEVVSTQSLSHSGSPTCVAAAGKGRVWIGGQQPGFITVFDVNPPAGSLATAAHLRKRLTRSCCVGRGTQAVRLHCAGRCGGSSCCSWGLLRHSAAEELRSGCRARCVCRRSRSRRRSSGGVAARAGSRPGIRR